MSRKMTKKDCSGCYCDFYNTGGVGGATRHCFYFNGAKLEKRKEVHVDQRPPWNQKAQLRPSCYQKPRFVYVGAD